MKTIALLACLWALAGSAATTAFTFSDETFNCAAPSGGGDVLTFDGGQTNTPSPTSPITYTYVGPSTTDRLLVVALSANSALGVSAVSYNSVAMTLWGAVTNVSGANSLRLYYLVAPATGSHTVSVTVASTSYYVGISTLSFSGVSQSSPVGSLASSSHDDVASEGLTVSSSTGNMVLDACTLYHGDSSPYTPVTGETRRCLTITDSGGGPGLWTGTQPGAASTVMGFTIGAARDYTAYLSGEIKVGP